MRPGSELLQRPFGSLDPLDLHTPVDDADPWCRVRAEELGRIAVSGSCGRVAQLSNAGMNAEAMGSPIASDLAAILALIRTGQPEKLVRANLCDRSACGASLGAHWVGLFRGQRVGLTRLGWARVEEIGLALLPAWIAEISASSHVQTVSFQTASTQVIAINCAAACPALFNERAVPHSVGTGSASVSLARCVTSVSEVTPVTCCEIVCPSAVAFSRVKFDDLWDNLDPWRRSAHRPSRHPTRTH